MKRKQSFVAGIAIATALCLQFAPSPSSGQTEDEERGDALQEVPPASEEEPSEGSSKPEKGKTKRLRPAQPLGMRPSTEDAQEELDQENLGNAAED